ncbi:MAG: hypothetical protein L6R28_23875 [Planctomycetes bacterium]|nr:hypothetical protein [Planctomycetota bacterium]
MHVGGNFDMMFVSAVKDLSRDWEATAAGWHDQARNDFEKEYVGELLSSARGAASAMSQISRLLQQAIKDCS